jgi:hypothetical protein
MLARLLRSHKRRRFIPQLELLEGRLQPSLFGPPTFYPLQTGPFMFQNADSVAAGDFNGDGKIDLVTANFESTIAVLLGNGDGTFQSPVFYPTGNSCVAVAVGDFSGDGKLDIVTANSADNDLSILMGKGDGTFLPAVNIPVGKEPVSLSVGDFNNDGRLDIAVVNQGDATISVLLGNGNCTFAAPQNYAAGTSPNSLTIGDFNGAGNLDLAVANSAGVGVLLGKGNGTFGPLIEHPLPQSPTQGAVPTVSGIVAGDFNGDGNLDLAVVDQPENALTVLLGNGDGTFGAPMNYATGRTPISVVAGDFNGAGKIDLAVANADGNSVSVLLGNGDGTFQDHIDFDGGTQPSGLAVADFNGDGKLDLAIADALGARVGILLNVSPTVLTPDQRFVGRLYSDLLHRQPDPAGLSGFNALLNLGVSRSQVVLDIESSLEYRTLEVENLYQSFLGRSADPSGLSAFVSLLGAGHSISEVKIFILGSPEYFARAGGTDGQFLAALYRDVLGRSIDPSGQATFSRLLDRGFIRSTVSFFVVHSAEARRDLVEGYYEQFLHRSADAVGLASFTARRPGGFPDELILAAILGSDEYFALAGN